MGRGSETLYWVEEGRIPDARRLRIKRAQKEAGCPPLIWRETSAEQIVLEAAAVLRAGGLVAFPTETVYGLGASALDESAVQAIFVAKRRPADNPLIAHIAEYGQMEQLCGHVPSLAGKLAERFWPGPISILVPALPTLPLQLTAGLPQVAVRMPRHDLARRLIARTGVPIAAPSANLSGRPSPTEAEHVVADLGGRIAGIVDGGPCQVGIESTVVEIVEGTVVILRPGRISKEEIEAAGFHARYDEGSRSGDKPRSPGQKYRHYAPRAPLYLICGTDPTAVREELLRRVDEARARGLRAAALLSGPGPRPDADLVIALSESGDAGEAASLLYGALRACDDADMSIVLVEGFGRQEGAVALMNRLGKAAEDRVIFV